MLTQNYEVLTNFPNKELSKIALREYNNGRVHLEQSVQDDKWKTYGFKSGQFIDYCYNIFSFTKYIRIRLTFSDGSLQLGPSHTDSNRLSAINLLVTPYGKQYLYTSIYKNIRSHEDNIRFKFNANPADIDRVNIYDSYTYKFKPQDYAYYSMKNPVILNTAMPHGFTNRTRKDRGILSIGFQIPYEELKEKIPKEWF